MKTDTKQCERTARAQGLAAGLLLALTGFDVLAMAPGRYAAVPAKTAPDAMPVLPHSLASSEDIVFIDCGRPRPAAATASGATFANPGQGGTGLAEFGRRLAAVRLGLTRRLLDAAVAHLSQRYGGGEPLVRKQLVTGTTADVISGIELLRQYACLPAADPPATGTPAGGSPGLAALADLHARITDLDAEVIGLFGAAGFIADHPVRALYVSALVANTWVPREQTDD
jgi:alkylation response protein AidB-like acyl-CoA dehydrogenase